MRPWRLLSLVLALALLLPVVPSRAQDPGPNPPRVIFIDDAKELLTSSMMDEGPDGVSKLAEIFRQLGADVDWLNLREPLPRDTEVIVIVRPLKALPIDQLARLWVQLLRGSHLLLAIDPAGLPVNRPERNEASNPDKATSGLSTLLYLFYGIGLQDAFVAEPWFTSTGISGTRTAHSRSLAEDFVPHPITASLLSLGLPVQMWGARPLVVEPFGISSYASPLLATQTAYGEINTRVFGAKPAPMEINLGKDIVGRLLVGAAAENVATGSRLVVLGDSEILQNDYGLANNFNTGEVQNWGNRILAEHIAAWLLGIPQEDWPGLPEGYTWLGIDGEPGDWSGRYELGEDADEDVVPIPEYDIRTVYAFTDNAYLYLQVETAVAPKPVVRLSVGIENTFDGVTDIVLYATANQVIKLDINGNPEIVPDASMTGKTVLEMRLPLRLVGEGGLISELCLSDSRTALTSAPQDCMTQPIGLIPTTPEEAPLDTWYQSRPMGVVYAPQGANLRTGPSTDDAVLTQVSTGKWYAAVGRNLAGDWIQVQDARMTGWLAAFLLDLNIDPMNLPVTTGEAIPDVTPGLPGSEGETEGETAGETPGTLAPGTGSGTHVVAEGDTLFSIALEHGVTVEALAAANDITNPSLIVVGQVLVIP
jgi:hypothetical protein